MIKFKKLSKASSIFLSLLLIVVLVGLSFSVGREYEKINTGEETSTAPTKTYRNEYLGYEIELPNKYNKESNVDSLFFNEYTEEEFDNFWSSSDRQDMYVYTIPVEAGKTFEETIAARTTWDINKENKGLNPGPGLVSKITLGNNVVYVIPWTLIHLISSGEYYSYYIPNSSGDAMYVFSSEVGNKDLRQIISTFKFI